MLADGSGTIDTVSTSHHEDYLANGLARPRRFTDVWCHPERLAEPLAWRKPSKVFVNSMSDLFHDDVPDEFIARVFAVMARAKKHTFQVLTKRPERQRQLMSSPDFQQFVSEEEERLNWADPDAAEFDARDCFLGPWPLPNVWLGVSVEDQPRADERIPLLLETPAAVRFISAEPLLGPLNLEAVSIPAPGAEFYGLRGVAQPLTEKDTEPDDWKYWTRKTAKLNWVIIGGESGPRARPCQGRWVRDIVRQCQSAGVPVFVKQLGAAPHSDDGSEQPNVGNVMRLRDRKGGDMSEWPEDLCRREFPR